MRLFELGSVFIIIIFAACVIAGAISVKYLGPDNALEQAAEAIIQEETGCHVDLSPENSASNQFQN